MCIPHLVCSFGAYKYEVANQDHSLFWICLSTTLLTLLRMQVWRLQVRGGQSGPLAHAGRGVRGQHPVRHRGESLSCCVLLAVAHFSIIVSNSAKSERWSAWTSLRDGVRGQHPVWHRGESPALFLAECILVAVLHCAPSTMDDHSGAPPALCVCAGLWPWRADPTCCCY